MSLKHITYTILAFVTFGCSTPSTNNKITQQNDYELFLSNSKNDELKRLKENLSFWEEKSQQLPNQYPYLSKIAAVHTNLFMLTGKISYLKEAEKNLIKVNERVFSVGNLRALARNYITQHRFKEALYLLKEAEKNGEAIAQTHKMLFDVYLELGHEKKAAYYLNQIQKYSDFDYYIRAGKWSDHNGDLEMAIEFLEKALHLAKLKKNKELMVWSYTNLADFYGHNNNIKKAYAYYLKSLEIQPENSYAKKGIAWIVYSFEKNPDEALRILETIKKEHESPDYSLMLAEIYDYKNNLQKKNEYLNSFLVQTANQSYGAMYRSHITKVLLDELNDNNVDYLIQEEIQSRATPVTYDLLAWSAYKKGNIKESLSIAKKHIVGRSSEPELLYHLAEIYKANGYYNETTKIKNELLACGYELGPLTFSKVQLL